MAGQHAGSGPRGQRTTAPIPGSKAKPRVSRDASSAADGSSFEAASGRRSCGFRRRDEVVTGAASIRWRRDAEAPTSPPLDLERLEPMKMERVAIARRLGEAQARQAGEQDRQRDRQLEPRQRRADAEMDAGAEGSRADWAIACGRRRSGRGKRAGSRLAAPSRRPILSPFLKRDAGELRVFERVAGEQVERRIEPQRFLDRRGGRAVVGERDARIDARARASPSPRCRSPGPSPRGRR